MAKNPTAKWDPLPTSSAGRFTGGPKKGVAHKTQGASYAGARGTYIKRSLGPHFTIGEENAGAILYQHLDTDEASSAVANDSGGVQTNKDGAIQVEIVGFSGVTAGKNQLKRFCELQKWLKETEGISLSWPMGRPPKDSTTGYGKSTRYRNAQVWDSTSGWYGHSNVPENTHWDPAWTDDEWAYIMAESNPNEDPEEEPVDVAQDFVLHPTKPGHGIQLDYLGGLHIFHPSSEPAMPTPNPPPPYWNDGQSPARRIRVSTWPEFTDGVWSGKLSGYIMDYKGGVHPFGGVPEVVGYGYW